ncbi:aminopeptidase P family N-terminal domain-containing protein, partial [Patescibacteria group bacterium]|nr:aminopeptidase P family N-terminal domain-containing protein [Patescibacteria group bacterium]
MKGYLITDPANVLYLTGFKSSNTFLLKTEKKNYLFTDNRYIDEARKLET